MASLRNIVSDNLEAYRYSNMETMFNPKEMGNEDWKDFYSELLFIQGYRGLIKPKLEWQRYVKRDDVVVQKNDEIECPICLEPFNKTVCLLSCNHLFHFECICRWYIINNYDDIYKHPKKFYQKVPKISCPICREDSIINRIYKECPDYIYKQENSLNNQNNQNNHDCKKIVKKPEIEDDKFRKKLDERLKYMLHVFSIYNKEYDRRLTSYETYQVFNEMERNSNQPTSQSSSHPYHTYHRPRDGRRRSSMCIII